MQPRFVLQRIAEDPAASVTAASARVVTRNTSPGSVPQVEMVFRLILQRSVQLKLSIFLSFPLTMPADASQMNPTIRTEGYERQDQT